MVQFLENKLVSLTFFFGFVSCIQIQKCCPFGQSLQNKDKSACADISNQLNFRFDNGEVIENIIVNKIKCTLLAPTVGNYLSIRTDGYLLEMKDGEIHENISEYCMDFEGSTINLVALIPDDCNVRKCCRKGQNFNDRNECQNATSQNTFYYDDNSTEIDMIVNDLEKNGFKHSFFSDNDNILKIDAGELIITPRKSSEINVTYKNFCVEYYESGKMVAKVYTPGKYPFECLNSFYTPSNFRYNEQNCSC